MDPASFDSWRAWIMTGNRHAPVNRRRVRGAHRGLKKMLAEGSTGDEVARPWNEFSGAMVRQAVNEALNQLPLEDMLVVKMAYFGGLSNREIARELGLTVGAVQRRLRKALGRVSEHLERGRAFGRRAAYAVVAWLTARTLLQAAHRLASVGADHAAAALIVVAAATAVALPAAPSPAPAPITAPYSVAAEPPTAWRARPVPAAGSESAGRSSPAVDGVTGRVPAAGATPVLPVPTVPLPPLPVVNVPNPVAGL